jgi:hypothetical protein
MLESVRVYTRIYKSLYKAAEYLNIALLYRLTSTGRGKSKEYTLQPVDFYIAKTIAPIKPSELSIELLDKYRIILNIYSVLVL